MCVLSDLSNSVVSGVITCTLQSQAVWYTVIFWSHTVLFKCSTWQHFTAVIRKLPNCLICLEPMFYFYPAPACIACR